MLIGILEEYNLDLSRFIKDAKNKPAGQTIMKMKIELAIDEDFKREVRPSAIIAAAHSSKFILNLPYIFQGHADFINNHNKAWAQLVENLTNWNQSTTSLTLPRKERIMVAVWHFPEVPTLFNYAEKMHALILVSQDAPWMKELRDAECTLNISSPGASEQLAREMEAGRIIAGVLDHFHPEMEFKETQFLGQTVRRPSGLLELCSRFKYLIVFVAPREEGIKIIDQVDATGKSAEELAQLYSSWLEAEVKRSPDSWLMWQALPSAIVRANRTKPS